jgi:hypothetical protein
MGVLYHLRHPLLALDLVAARARRLVVIQTLTTPERPGHEIYVCRPAGLPADVAAELTAATGG